MRGRKRPSSTAILSLERSRGHRLRPRVAPFPLDAGGTLAKPIFAFPGGRRFHFLDPGGNELARVKGD